MTFKAMLGYGLERTPVSATDLVEARILSDESYCVISNYALCPRFHKKPACDRVNLICEEGYSKENCVYFHLEPNIPVNRGYNTKKGETFVLGTIIQQASFDCGISDYRNICRHTAVF